jgi:hypothetical protein
MASWRNLLEQRSESTYKIFGAGSDGMVRAREKRFTLSLEIIEIRRPRVRNLDERFGSRVLRLFKRKEESLSRRAIPTHHMRSLGQQRGGFEGHVSEN